LTAALGTENSTLWIEVRWTDEQIFVQDSNDEWH